MSKLLAARILFTKHLARLLLYATDLLGFAVIIDEVKRSKEAAKWNATHCKVRTARGRCEQTPSAHRENRLGHTFRKIGIATSLHINALAVDLLIIVDGKISNDPELYRILGEWWEKQFPAAAWGGRFNDMGHFSHGFNGRK